MCSRKGASNLEVIDPFSVFEMMQGISFPWNIQVGPIGNCLPCPEFFAMKTSSVSFCMTSTKMSIPVIKSALIVLPIIIKV